MITVKDDSTVFDQPKWQRITLLSILAYEGFGGVLGGMLLVGGPDGHFMNMPVGMMHGVFPDFFVPGLILTELGILTIAAFVVVYRKTTISWILANLALWGFTIWFLVEIAILGQLHWLHIMWGVPVLVGDFLAFALVPWDKRSVYQMRHHISRI